MIINYSNGKYSLIKANLPSIELISILDDCYNFINDSAKTLSLGEMHEIVKNYLNEEIDLSQFAWAIKEDDRFIVTENNVVLVK